MSELPNPKEFNHTLNLVDIVGGSRTSSNSYDLVKMDKQFKAALLECDTLTKRALSNELISFQFWRSTPNIAAKKYFGYSKKHNSLTVHLYNDAGEIQAIAIRNADGTKWKTFGSKKFTPYKIRKDIIFLTSGMAEIVISDIMSLSFIGLQSDSMVKHLPKELKELAAGKFIVVLSDNDDTFRGIIPQIERFFTKSQTIIIDFGKMLERELPKGYDFRDFVNEVGDAKKVLELLEGEILKGGSYV